jgi:hypothetical protein
MEVSVYTITKCPDASCPSQLTPPPVLLCAAPPSVQHYEWPNPFHRTRAKFAAQVKRDALKVELCKARGVRLIVVPHTVQRTEIEAFLVTQLAMLEGVTVDQDGLEGAYRATLAPVPMVPAEPVVVAVTVFPFASAAEGAEVAETTGPDLTRSAALPSSLYEDAGVGAAMAGDNCRGRGRDR